MIFQAASNREVEIQTEDEQAFLARQQEVLKSGGQERSESPLRSQASKALPRTPGSVNQNSPTRKVKSKSDLLFIHINHQVLSVLVVQTAELILITFSRKIPL